MRLVHRLDAAVSDPVLGSAQDDTCLVVADAGDVVYARQADLALIPASTMKVLTGMAALTRLGSDTRLVTEARAVAGPDAGGTVDGSLWIVGAGDPLLSTGDYVATFRNQPQVHTPLENLADRIVEDGVQLVRGSIIGDESRYDTERYVASWPARYITDSDVGPASALTVNDGFAQYPPAGRRVAASAPARHAAAVLTALLQARGVRVEGPPSSGAVDGDATTVVGAVASPPMAEIVGEMIRESDNLTAELLVKELGARFGEAGTWEAGLAVVRETVAARGLRTENFEAVDGSGLSRRNRLSCSVLMQAMEIVGPDSALARAFPVAAETGTLADRFHGNPAAGRLRAKTGSLRGVAGLTGYVEGGAGRLLAFALLANELPRDAYGRSLQEAVGAALVRYPEAPAADTVGPQPPRPPNPPT